MKLEIDHGYIAYERVGKGIPLLFIHGYPLSRKIWQPQISALADVASVVSIDLRGHGDSYPFDPPYPMELLADDCKVLLDHLGLTQPVVVCGLSMGGYVTLALFRKYLQSFRAMILTSTRAGADAIAGKANRDTTVKNAYAHGVDFIADAMLNKVLSPNTLTSNPQLVNSIHQIMLETSLNGIVGASLGMRDRLDSTPLLPHIHIPVLIVQGADDQLIPLTEAQAMHHQIAESKLTVIPEAGHLPNMEQPDLFNRSVREFLQTLY